MSLGPHDSSSAETAENRLPADTGLFDFRSVANFPRDYLATYYCQPPTADEQMVLAFLAQHYPKLESQPCAIEIGCGPTVHHVLPLAPFVSEIHMADYLPGNLRQVRRWRDGEMVLSFTATTVGYGGAAWYVAHAIVHTAYSDRESSWPRVTSV
jgi:hypothetical protein